MSAFFNVILLVMIGFPPLTSPRHSGLQRRKNVTAEIIKSGTKGWGWAGLGWADWAGLAGLGWAGLVIGVTGGDGECPDGGNYTICTATAT